MAVQAMFLEDNSTVRNRPFFSCTARAKSAEKKEESATDEMNVPAGKRQASQASSTHLLDAVKQAANLRINCKKSSVQL